MKLCTQTDRINMINLIGTERLGSVECVNNQHLKQRTMNLPAQYMSRVEFCYLVTSKEQPSPMITCQDGPNCLSMFSLMSFAAFTASKLSAPPHFSIPFTTCSFESYNISPSISHSFTTACPCLYLVKSVRSKGGSSILYIQILFCNLYIIIN